MFHSLVACIGLLISWANAVAFLGSIGGFNQNPLSVGGASLSHDGLPAITAAPTFPLVKRQANSYIGYVSDATGC
jgi:hypothetical protein